MDFYLGMSYTPFIQRLKCPFTTQTLELLPGSLQAPLVTGTCIFA